MSFAEAIQFSRVGRLGRAYTFGSWIIPSFSAPLLAATTSKATNLTSVLSFPLTVVRERFPRSPFASSFSIKVSEQKVLVLPGSSKAYV